MNYIGLDIGTTGCKATLFSSDGNLQKRAYRAYPLIADGTGRLELDPRDVWKKVREVLREIAVGAQNIWGLSLSVLGEATTPLDDKGNFLDNTVVSFDNRTVPYVDWWVERIDPFEVFQLTGMPPHSMYPANKILWWKHNKPDVFERADKFLCWEGLVSYMLTGHAVVDYSMVSRSMLFDVKKRQWSDKMLSLAGLSPDILAEPVPSGTVIGAILPAIAGETGLPAGTQVVSGGHDLICGAAGAGIIEPGLSVYITGTVDGIVSCIGSEPILNRPFFDNNLSSYPHVFKEKYCTVNWNYTGGNLLQWYRDTFGEKYKEEAADKGCDPYDLIVSELPEDPSRLLVLPHFTMTGTPYCDPDSAGAVIGLRLDTSEREFIKALLEGVVYEMRLNLKALNECGIKTDRLRAVGGGAVSPVWMQIKADIMGLPVESMETNEASGAGAAMCAFIASGEGDEKEAISRFVRVKKVFEPDSRRAGIYDEKFKAYQEIYPMLKRLKTNSQ